LLLFRFARREKWRFITWLAGIPLASISLLGAAVLALVAFEVVRATIPRCVYEDTFHERPSTDVRHIKSKTWSFADEAHVFMSFEASPETFHRILPSEMERVTFTEYRDRMPRNNLVTPPWWVAPQDDTREIYLRVAREDELMTYDPSAKSVMYFYLRID